MIGLYPVLGWVGTLAYLLGYFLLSINKINARQMIYHMLNVVGALGLDRQCPALCRPSKCSGEPCLGAHRYLVLWLSFPGRRRSQIELLQSKCLILHQFSFILLFVADQAQVIISAIHHHKNCVRNSCGVFHFKRFLLITFLYQISEIITQSVQQYFVILFYLLITKS